jgi:hypothetical protein
MTPVRQLAFHGAHDVHHLREALNDHELGRSNSARHADATEVVSSQVDEHRVLRALLRVRKKLVLVQTVAELGFPPRPRARDRSAHDRSSLDAHERLRRRTRELESEHPHEEHVRRRVRYAETPVHGKAAARRGEADATRRNDLIDVAREDMLLHRPDDVAEVVVRHVRVAAARVEESVAERLGGRSSGRRDAVGELLQRVDGAVVAAGRNVRDEQQPLPPVVEHDRPVDDEQADRWRRGLAGGNGVSVDELRGLVGKEADESTRERGEPVDARSSKACRQGNEIAASVAG